MAGSERRRRRDAQRNRDAILAAAVADLRRTGSVHARRVAAAVGVSRSTLYRHFPARAALEEALRGDALAAVRRAIDEAATDERPPLAVLRGLVERLVGVGAERRLDVLDALPLEAEGDALCDALQPTLERLRRAAELTPSPPTPWIRRAALAFVGACLASGSTSIEDPGSAADGLFRSLTDPLDRGLMILDEDGQVLSANPRALALDAREDLVYEDGSPSPASAHPIAAAVRTNEPQAGIRGHRDDRGGIRWVALDARPLRAPGDGGVYGFVGVLADVTAERDWQLGRLLPPGQLAQVRPVPLDVVRTLDEIPPHLFPEQFVSEARRISGAPTALYVLDIDGTNLLRLAGPDEFPERLPAPLSLGPELAEDGIPELTASLRSELPGVTVAPMWLRGRAIGLLLGLRAPEEPLVELGRLGAAALELAAGYTDLIDGARRRKETHAAAELQQSLLPPRIARIGGGELAGTVLPSYEVGGDWFDYVENYDGAWIAIADAVGKGATAGALGGIALAALRAARRSDRTLEEAARTMHEVVYDVGRPEFFVTAIVGRWQAVYGVFSWINCGHPPPLVVSPTNAIEQLTTTSSLPLGLLDRDRRFVRHQRRLADGERLILHSDGITARRTSEGLFGLDGIERAIGAAPSRSAPALAKAIQEAVMAAAEDPLQDDAIAVVLAPSRAPSSEPGR